MPGIVVGIDDNGNEIREFDFPTQKEINACGTPFFSACWELHNNIELFGLPHGKGWMHERQTILQIHKICVSEKNRYNNWRMEKGKDLDDRD